MQLWVGDYLGDTRNLTTTQHGAYLLLLMCMWRADGDLPNDDRQLARMAGLTVRGWLNIKDGVMELFPVTDGRITQKRLTAELLKCKSKTEKRACAGKAGGEAKALKDKELAVANAMRLPCHSSEPESESKKKQEKAAPTAQPDLPDWLDREAWGAFLEMRRRKRAPVTARAMMLLLGKLDRWRLKGHDPTAILDTSTASAWTDLYEPKEEHRNGNGRLPRKSNHETFFDAASAVAARIQGGPSEEARSPHEATILLLPGRSDKIAN